MVELKSWIAKDATNHGQLISDSDLTDEAIFDRLENDIAFRSVATALVQTYGFLKPTVNPESPMAQEQQLLIRERARWIAQDEETSRSKSRQQQQKGLSETEYCDPTTDDCPSQGNSSDPSIQALPSQPTDYKSAARRDAWFAEPVGSAGCAVSTWGTRQRYDPVAANQRR